MNPKHKKFEENYINIHNKLFKISNIFCFQGGSDGKEFACNEGDLNSVPALEDPLEDGMTTHSSILV